MIDKGKVAFVSRRSVGSSLDGDHSSGATTITVDNTFVFDELGGQLSINDVTYTYTGYDDDASTITLAAGLAADADDGEQVILLPEAIEVYANVTMDGTDPAIDCLVPHELSPWLTLGPRTPELAETVTVERGVDGFEVLNVLGQPAILDPGDIASTETVIYLNGPPTHYVSTSEATYVDYDTMLAAAGADWAAAVSGLVFDNGALTVPMVDVEPDGWPDGGGSFYMPAWLIPTDGRPCRIVIDNCVADPSEFLEGFEGDSAAWSAPTYAYFNRVMDDTLTDNSDDIDTFGFQNQFRDDTTPSGTGVFIRQWLYHVLSQGDSPASLPADAVFWADTADFQTSPMPSLNQAEADVFYGSDPGGNGAFAAFVIWEPVYDYWTRATDFGFGLPPEVYGGITFNYTGVRVVRS